MYEQAIGAQSCLKPFPRFHKMTFCGRNCMIIRATAKKPTVDSSIVMFFSQTKIFQFINCFQGFQNTLMKIVTLV